MADDEKGRRIEADLQQTYGVSFYRLIGSGEYERAYALIENIPTTSRTVAAIDGRARWDDADYLLAYIADNIAFMRYEQSGGKGRKPKRYTRPSRGGTVAEPGRTRTVHGWSKARVWAALSRPRT